jgi:methane monooxygenase component A beta chain/propane monooxygenase small subunit
MLTPHSPRDFTYIRPRKRRLSEYEAVTCYTQPDPAVFDKQGWYLLTAEGRPAWRQDSTHLRHPHWFDFRDPASLWQRPYVRMQAEQERSIERVAEDAAKAGAFRDFQPKWSKEVVGGHYRIWSFFEYGMFRAFSQAQREVLSDTLGSVFCFEAVDRARHAQAIVIYLMDMEDNIEGFADSGAKNRWIHDARYQPMRRLTEQVMVTDDWGELAVAVNLVIDPILSEVGLSQLVRRFAPHHGDSVTPVIVFSAERDRRRNQAWTEELVRMVTAPEIPAAAENAEIIQRWIDRWTPLALEATVAMAGIYELPPVRVASFAQTLARAREQQATLVESLRLRPYAEAGS